MKVLIPFEWSLPEVFASRLGDSAGRQRAMESDGHLLLVLHEPPGHGQPTRSARLFWRDPFGEWKASTHADGLLALRRLVDAYGERYEGLERLSENATTARLCYDLLLGITPLQRAARNLHSALQAAREAVPEDRDIINLRDQAGDVERSVELLYHDARNGLDFLIAQQAEIQSRETQGMARSAYRLNLLAAGFLPIATLAAVFGMNLNHGLGESQRSPVAFWLVLGVGMLAGLVITQLIADRPAKSEPPARKFRPRNR